MLRWLSLSGSVTVIALCLSACKNQAPPAAEAATAAPALPTAASTPGAEAQAAPLAAPAAPAASKYSEAGFDLAIQPKGTYAGGQAGEAEVVLVAKAPFHVNDKYPYKFKLKEAQGLRFANLVVGKESVKLEPMRATVPVAFTPDAGKHALAGQLSFSVCTADQCMIEKRDLTLEIEAK
jgi:pyruvate/2-oxoglutarate dehydrogenase complex dihydrolipoamide acyltransferase (E2) component